MSALATIPAPEFTADQIATLKSTVAVGCSDHELDLFVAACKRTKLDPFTKQIYAMKLGSKLSIQVSIDGFRIIAERSGEYEGQEGPYWCGPDGVWKDVWLDKTQPLAAAKVIVLRKGHRPMVGIARFAAYSTGQNLWNKMGDLMIAKCAEALALRKAIPNDLSGISATEEMDQAHKGAELAATVRTLDDLVPKGEVVTLPAATATLPDPDPDAPPPSKHLEFARSYIERIGKFANVFEADNSKKKHAKELNALKKDSPEDFEMVKRAFEAKRQELLGPAPEAVAQVQCSLSKNCVWPNGHEGDCREMDGTVIGG